MKKVVIFTACDQNNFKYAVDFLKSLTKFHSPKDIDIILYTNAKEPEKSLPEGIIIKDLTPYLQDQAFWYRQKPLLASELIDEYELVVGMDCDQIVLGDLNHILEDTSYDVGTVLNFNRADYNQFGPITTYIINCTQYFNCGLVAMRSKAFIEHWKKLCLVPDIFENLQFREQDILNIMCKFGLYTVKCFDFKDPFSEIQMWNGLVSGHEGLRMILKDNQVYLPKEETGYPTEDVIVKIYHFAGPQKPSFRTQFSEEIIEHIEKLIK